MPVPDLTEEEIIAYLQRSELPTILVEGKTDATVCRWIESKLGILSGSVLACSGKTVLLSIYKKRHILKRNRLVWLADLDVWVHTGVPEGFEGVIFTSGYSIENDLYAGSRLEDLLEEGERASFSELISTLCQWSAFELDEYRQGRECIIAPHINQVVDFASMKLSSDFCHKRGFREPKADAVLEISKEYQLRVRGKSLFQGLVHILSAPSRPVKHSKAALIEVSLKLHSDNPYIRRIIELSVAHLSDTGVIPQE